MRVRVEEWVVEGWIVIRRGQNYDLLVEYETYNVFYENVYCIVHDIVR